MEFFQETVYPDLTLDRLRALLTIRNLPTLCESISTVISDENQRGEIYSIWGQFRISREEIICGVRFSLLDCPHAFAWTITYHAENQRLVVHCTIDKQQHEQDFIDSIHDFTRNWLNGLLKHLS